MVSINPKRSLSGELNASTDAKQLIIICHGYKSSSDHPTLTAIANGLNDRGYATFTFNFTSRVALDIESQVMDIADIVEHFHEQYQEIILLAASFGALTASIATNKVPGVSRLITLNGFFGTGQLGPKHRKTYRLFRASALVMPSQRKILNYFKKGLQPANIKVPSLVIHTDTDEVVSIEQSKHFYRQLQRDKQFKVLASSNHNITDSKHVVIVVDYIDDWLRL